MKIIRNQIHSKSWCTKCAVHLSPSKPPLPYTQSNCGRSRLKETDRNNNHFICSQRTKVPPRRLISSKRHTLGFVRLEEEVWLKQNKRWTPDAWLVPTQRLEAIWRTLCICMETERWEEVCRWTKESSYIDGNWSTSSGRQTKAVHNIFAHRSNIIHWESSR